MSLELNDLRSKQAFVIDMDGVLYHGNRLLPGVQEFVAWLHTEEKRFVFLTNNSERSPRELQQKLSRLGVEVDESHFYTSALATASFLQSQCPNGSVYAIGEAGLTNALYDVGFSMNDVNPEYVVVGETRTYNIEKIERAVRLVNQGAKLIGTNSDLTGPTEHGIMPACRALIAPIELATGRSAYFVGKPNPLIMRQARKMLDRHSADTVIIGDRMDTDIVAGIESGIDTVLVLSGVTDIKDLPSWPYQPTYVLEGVKDILQ